MSTALTESDNWCYFLVFILRDFSIHPKALLEYISVFYFADYCVLKMLYAFL